MRPLASLIACCLLAAAVLTGCGSGEPSTDVPTAAEARRELAGSPPPLAALHRQANALLPGGVAAFERRMEELRGTPVVVNAWAEWCGPCKEEFPVFQRMAVRYGRGVGFLGIDVEDSRRRARAFLDDNWLPYPSYEDPDREIAREIGATVGIPTTVFFDADGDVAFTHQGPYRQDADLERDLQRYLGAVPSS